MKKINWKKIIIDFLIIVVLLYFAGTGNWQSTEITEVWGYLLLILLAVFYALVVPFMGLYPEGPTPPEIENSKVLITLGFNTLAIIAGFLISISVNLQF